MDTSTYGISNEAIDLLKRMLTVDPFKRLSSEKALEDKWIVHAEETKSEELIRIQRLKKFASLMNVHNAILTFISTQELSLQEETKLKSIYKSFDTDHDGKLNLEDIKQGYKLMYGEGSYANEEANLIIQRMNLKKEDNIEFKGKLLLSNKMVRFCFGNIGFKFLCPRKRSKTSFCPVLECIFKGNHPI